MKIIVTSTGDGMNATVDPHFGRCSYFAIVDTESGDFEAIANQYKDAAGGAGTKAAQFIIDKGVGALLTGHCGPKASEVLDDTDIQIVSGINKGTVQIGEDEHVAHVNTLPTPYGRAVKAQAVLKYTLVNLFYWKGEVLPGSKEVTEPNINKPHLSALHNFQKLLLRHTTNSSFHNMGFTLL